MLKLEDVDDRVIQLNDRQIEYNERNEFSESIGQGIKRVDDALDRAAEHAIGNRHQDDGECQDRNLAVAEAAGIELSGYASQGSVGDESHHHDDTHSDDSLYDDHPQGEALPICQRFFLFCEEFRQSAIGDSSPRHSEHENPDQ